jgi:DNA polymerase-3 subunit delta'
MLFSEILGQEHIKTHLKQSAQQGRIPHAQLFVGPEGCGALPMAIAYAQYILCGTSGTDNLKEGNACHLKCTNLSHPDLHFVYPTVTNEDVKTKPKSGDFISEWRSFIAQNPYGNVLDWYAHLGAEKKQGLIRVDDAQEIVKNLSLKSYEGGYKVMIIWMAELMNVEAANKLLKIIEEPTPQTLLILVAEQEHELLQTIRSRCQVIHFKALPQQTIAEALITEQFLTTEDAFMIAHQAQGNYNRAIKLLMADEETLQFEAWFVEWVRVAFRAKGNAKVLRELLQWSEKLSKLSRSMQMRFLEYCIEMFRQAFLLHYRVQPLVYMKTQSNFNLENFAPFVSDKNIQPIFKELSEAIYHIDRNANGKLIFTDLSIKLTRYIHQN